MQKNSLRKDAAARILFPQGNGMGRVPAKQVKIVGKCVGQRHKAIVELQKLPDSAGAGGKPLPNLLSRFSQQGKAVCKGGFRISGKMV